MRIKFIIPFPLDEDGAKLRESQLPQEFIPPGVEVVWSPVKNSGLGGDSQYDTFLMDIFCFEEGLKAEEEGLDLVEVAPTANPPVCKIMDYGKYKYQQKKKLHAAKKHHHQQTKEIRLRLKTEEHDLQVKVKHAREFLEKGDRVLVNLLLRGREMAHADLARNVVDHFTSELEEFAKVDKPPTLERNKVSALLVPKEHGK